MATKLGDLAVGSVVKINEKGSPVDFYIAEHNYESALNGFGRTLLVRKDCFDERIFDDSKSNSNEYLLSELDTWLNSTYKEMLDEDIRTAIGTTKIRLTLGEGDSGAVGADERGVFVLSLSEFGLIYKDYSNTEGTKLSIASTLAVAYLNEERVEQWTRSPYTYGSISTCTVDKFGRAAASRVTVANASRPAFTLSRALYLNNDGFVQIKAPGMAFAASIDGVSRELGPLVGGVDGVARELQAAAVIDGIQRDIF